MDEPGEILREVITPDEKILVAAIELKSALDDFRKTVLNAMEQKHLAKHIRDPIWLNSRQAEQMLKICSRTLRRYREQKLISYSLTNRIYRYKYIDIKAFLDNSKFKK